MKVEDLEIPGVRLAHLTRHEDERGWFMELLREEIFGVTFVQSNHSHSRPNVLRGLHYHAKQSDAWYVVGGRCRVGLADLRTASPSPGSLTVDLASDEPAVLYVPPGVAHGFHALTELDLVYWVTHYFDNSDEHGVMWDDPVLAVPWGTRDPILSQRDRAAGALDWSAVAAALAGGSNRRPD